MQLPKEGAATTPQAQRAAPPSLDALVAFVQSVYGPLDDAGLEQVRGVLDGLAQALAAIDAFPLDNAAEPAPSFAPYRAD
jgi:hypothetical protein